MPNNRRIFVAAWEYPPIMSGESVVCKRTLEYSEYNYDLCCGYVSAILPDCKTDNEKTDNEHICIYPVAGNKYLQWPWRVAKKFRRLDTIKHYKVMMSRVMPPNGHLAGWLIKRLQPSIKWIVYFSDPIWNSPFLKFTWRKDREQRPNWLLMKLFGIPAKWAVKEADLLVFNNDRLAHLILGSKYEHYKSKTLIVPYGHDGIKLRPEIPRKDGRFCLTHVGQIYGNRTLQELIAGLELLRCQDVVLYERLWIRLVGFCSDTERERVAKSVVAEKIEFVDTVPYSQSIEEMYSADALLVIDPVFTEVGKNVYIPGKLFDYMSTGRPIICIADRNSATGDVAEKIGCIRADPKAEMVCGALQNICKNAGRLKNVDKFYCGFGVEKLDSAIDKLFD